MRQTKMFSLIGVILLGWLAIPVFPKPVSKEQAKLATSHFLAQDPEPLGAALYRSIQSVSVYNAAAGEAAWYVVQLSPAGFVITSADDLIEPIIGFSAAGTFDPSDQSPLFALVKHDLSNRSKEARAVQTAGNAPAVRRALRFSQAESKWNHLLASVSARSLEPESSNAATSLTAVSDLRVGSFVKSRWSQQNVAGSSACYNYYTPPGPAGSAQNYPCGCVATALAQLLRYYRYPVLGVGRSTFPVYVDWVLTKLALRGGNGLGGPYNWDKMSLTPDPSATLAERQAIGSLCYDASVSILTEYTASASSANPGDAATNILNVFGYANARIAYVAVSGQTMIPGFNDIVNPNLDAGFPVMLTIHSFELNANHEILCDGYGYQSATLYHHLNMGWGGVYDLWYNLPTIDDNASYKFEIAYACVYNIYPTGSGEIVSGRVTDSRGKVASGVKVTAQRTKGGSWTATTNSRGIYALSKLPSNSVYSISTAGATSKTVTLGESVNSKLPTGNRWGIDFKVAAKNSVSGWTYYE